MGIDEIKDRLIALINDMPEDQLGDLLKLLEWGRNEKRKSPRKTCIIRTDFSTQDNTFTSYAKNISAGAVFIETQETLSVGQDVSMAFSLFSFEGPLKIKGKIVRTDPLGIVVKFDRAIQEFLSTHQKREEQNRNHGNPKS